jgi:hypothetical protein
MQDDSSGGKLLLQSDPQIEAERSGQRQKSWTDRVRNGEVLRVAKEDRNVIHTIKRRRADLIGHILRRNCRLKHTVVRKVGGIEVTGIQGRRRKQLPDDLKEARGYYKLKADALNCTVWRTRFGRVWNCRRADCGMMMMMGETRDIREPSASLIRDNL